MSATATSPRTVVLSFGDTYYDAAATNREADFGRFLLSVGEDFTFSGPTRSVVIGRLRREIRNNPYLAGLVNKYPEAIGTSTLRSRTSSRAYNDLKDVRWYRWAKQITFDGDSLRTVEDIVKREDLNAGETFLVKLMSGRVQMIPSEYCGSGYAGESTATPAGLPAGSRECNGIVRNAAGIISHYRFGKMSAMGAISFTDSTLVEARHVIHIFEKDRIFMGRGIPRLISSLRPAHDLYEITRAKTKQIKDVASIFGTLEKAGAAEYLQSLGALGSAADISAPETTDSPANPVTKGPVRIELKPGTFFALEPGEKLNRLQTDYEATDYKELIMILLHTISTPVGLPVELWFSGLGDVSYSGFKGLGTQWNARRKYLIGYYEEKFLDPLYQWWTKRETDLGDLPPNPDNDDDLVDWRWRATAVLDEEKARKANQIALSTGEISLADVWEAAGYYAEEVLAERRQLWIKLCLAAGEIQEDPTGRYETEIVPKEFLLRGLLPGEVPAIIPPPDPEPPERPPAPKS